MSLVNKIIFVSLLMITTNTYSQIIGTVLNANSKTPIPYANIWVENSSIGTTSDVRGAFNISESLIGRTLIVSAIGYGSISYIIDSICLELYLEPRIYQIPEVNVQPYQGQTELMISTYKKDQVKEYTSPIVPIIFARQFQLNESQILTPFIKKIQINTYSYTDCIINLRFFSVTESGEPGDDLLDRNLLVKVKKGVRKTSISVIDMAMIRIPAEGVYIAFEHLIIPENGHALRYKGKDNKRGKVLAYMPGIGLIESTIDDTHRAFYSGKWGSVNDNSWVESLKTIDSLLDLKHKTIAMEVIVSN